MQAVAAQLCICACAASRLYEHALTHTAPPLQAMFPNCSRHACNDYPTCSGTRAFCNESAANVDTWPLRINGLSKSAARTAATADLSLHVHDLKPG